MCFVKYSWLWMACQLSPFSSLYWYSVCTEITGSRRYMQRHCTLAAGQVPYHLQNCYHHASDFPPSMPVVPPDFIVFASADSNVRQLCSSTTRAAAVKRSRTQFGRRAFSVTGPDIWKSLPATIRTINSHPAFHRALQTHLFRSAVDY